MKEFKEIQMITEILASVKCNRCGKEMRTSSSLEGNGVNINYEGGYDSEIIGDGVSLNFDICEECLSKMIEQLKIPPSRVEYDSK